MATLLTLIKAEVLVSIGGGLGPHEQPQRSLCAYPHVIKWLDETLPNLEPTMEEGTLSPLQQVDVLFHDFVAGEDFSYYRKAHLMDGDDGVWD